MTARTEILPLTVVIAARNEAANIMGCIDSVRWASEIIVAENGSDDETVDLAQAAGAIVLREDATTIGGQRNVAIARAANAWVLVVDADERGTLELRDAVASVLDRPVHEAYRVPRKNIFLGAEIRHGGWERDRPVRLFRSTLRYNDSRVHEHVQVSGEVGVVDGALRHYPYASMDQYFEKFNRYSRWWADQHYARGKRVTVFGLVCRPLARFLKMYVVQLGFLDGAPGLVLSLLASASVLAKYVRLWGKQWAA